MSDETNTTQETAANQNSKAESILHNWRDRLEDLLKAKNLDELKSEFKRIGGDLQTEIQNFDLNEHLSPAAKSKVKDLEKRYNEVLKSIHKAQKQFDREFSKALKVMKSTQKDAEKKLDGIKKKVAAQKKQITKVTGKMKNTVKKTIVKKAKSAKKKAAKKK